MFKFTKHSHRVITKSLAEQWRDTPTIAGDRNLLTSRMESIRREILAGRVRVFEWAIGRLPDGTAFRVNGKHSSNILASLEPFPLDCRANIDEYACEDMNDVVALYDTFDPGFSGRSQGNVNQSVLCISAMNGKVGLRDFSCCQAGIMVAKYGHASTGIKRISPADRARATAAESDFLMFFSNLVTGVDATKMLRRSSVASAMFQTWTKDRNDAQTFWTAVRDETDQVGSPTRILAKYLSRTVIIHSGKPEAKKDVDLSSSMEYKCLLAWNAWRKKTTLKVLPGVSVRPVVV